MSIRYDQFFRPPLELGLPDEGLKFLFPPDDIEVTLLNGTSFFLRLSRSSFAFTLSDRCIERDLDLEPFRDDDFESCGRCDRPAGEASESLSSLSDPALSFPLVSEALVFCFCSNVSKLCQE